MPRLAPVLLLLLDGRELLAQLGDAVADLAPVELDRRLAGALAALALLASRRLAHARRDVGQAGDLDLQPRLAAARVAMEDVDDEAGAIEDPGSGRALEVSRLARGELVIDHDDRGLLQLVVLGGLVVVGAPDRSRTRSPSALAPCSSLRARPTARPPCPR